MSAAPRERLPRRAPQGVTHALLRNAGLAAQGIQGAGGNATGTGAPDPPQGAAAAAASTGRRYASGTADSSAGTGRRFAAEAAVPSTTTADTGHVRLRAVVSRLTAVGRAIRHPTIFAGCSASTPPSPAAADQHRQAVHQDKSFHST